MPLNKFASWGVAPRAEPPVVGIAAVLADNAVSRKGFLAVAAAIKKIGRAQAEGPGEQIDTPSYAAVEIVAALVELRELLFDDCASIEAFNSRLDALGSEPKVEQAFDQLEEMAELGLQFTQLFAPLDDDADFDQQRRLRIAEMVAVEWQVLAEVDDPDDDAEQELA